MWGFSKLYLKEMLKVSVFYLEKQKSFIPQKIFFKPDRQKMSLAVLIFSEGSALLEYVINNWDKDQFCGRFTVFFISITDSSFWHRASNYVFMFFFKSSLWKRPNTTAFIASAFIFFCLSIFFFPWVEGGFSYLFFLTFFCLATSLSLHASKLNWPFFVFFFCFAWKKVFLCWNLILNLFFCSKNGYLDFLPF